jgi:hypothetical protein
MRRTFVARHPIGKFVLVHAIRDFYNLFDTREQGNHLIAFQASSAAFSIACGYRAYLPCAEPGDVKIVTHPLGFEFAYRASRDGQTFEDKLQIRFDGHAYWAALNGIGPLYLHPTYRSLLIAEMEFLRLLIESGVDDLSTYETRSLDLDYRCSKFSRVKRESYQLDAAKARVGIWMPSR